MQKLTVIAGFGGINTAGRSSGHQAFRRIVLDALSAQEQLDTLNALAQLMGLEQHSQIDESWRECIKQGTLIRGWDNLSWDANAVPFHEPFTDADGRPCWRLSHKRLAVQSAGQLPKGFNPASLYPSRHHPRGLQMAIYGISDTLGQLGLDWDVIRQHLAPDDIAVYAGSVMGQQDDCGHGGMMQAALLGKRTSSKQCALGLSDMTADFINAYVLGNVGATGSASGACASFLYNLRLALDDLHSGRRRLVIVGNSEAPLVPEIVEGFHAMTALITEQKLRALDGLSSDQTPNYARSSRPFGQNAGFTLAESAQFFVLTDDELAMELGLSIYGAVGDVFIHADGFKKSISNPGIGNHLSVGKAFAYAERVLGIEALQQGSFMHAHGSSTPANRTSESELLNRLAQCFHIDKLPVTAVKAHLGHSLAPASADQLMTCIGTWSQGIIPGITTTHAIADDVECSNLNILLQHTEIDVQRTPLAFINAKGFGGNNATGVIISPQQTNRWLQQKYGNQAWTEYQHKNEAVQHAAQQWHLDTTQGLTSPRYQFGEQVLDSQDIDIDQYNVRLPNWTQPISF